MFSQFLETAVPVAEVLPIITIGTATVKGIAVDRLGYLSAVLEYIAGINPSVPTGFTVAIKVQHSDTTTDGDFVDFITSIATFGAADSVAAASVVKYYDLDLTGAKRYIRTVNVLTFTGGSSPSSIWAETFFLGDKNVEPAGNAVVYSAD
jgi:hypothetical protein